MKLRVESTETGEIFNLRLESSVDKLKQQVKLFTQIPPQDQILLIGPPFKILDTQYGPNLKLDGKRVFVFNRKIIIDENLEHNRLRLLPFDVAKPQLLEDILPSNAVPSAAIAASPSPSAQYLMEFERYFLEQLKRGQCYETFIQDVYNNCRAAVAQHQVQLDGIDAAICNLRDTYASVQRPVEQLERRLSAQQAGHRSLLESFEANLARLADIPVHQSIVAAVDRARADGAANPTSSTSSSLNQLAELPVVRSLYDCVPVERERAYFRQCEDSFRKVDEQLVRVRTLYGAVSASVDELAVPAVDFARLNALVEMLNGEVAGQAAVIAEMKRNYQFVYDTITAASHAEPAAPAAVVMVAGSNATTDSHHSSTASSASVGKAPGELQLTSDSYRHSGYVSEVSSTAVSQLASPSVVAVGPPDLEELVSDMAKRKYNQERQHLLAAMEARAAAVKAIEQEIEDSQNALVRQVYSLLRRVARCQTDIQYRLKKDLEWMRRWTVGPNEFFRHLEHLAALPEAYRHLLQEVVRRKAYNGVFEGEVSGATDKIAQLRAGEIRERELFMGAYGLSLPPLFFRVIPTLKDKPPFFTPQVTDAQWLPDVGYEDLDTDAALGLRNSGNYTLTNQQQHQQLSRLNAAAGDDDDDRLSSPQQQQHVSMDDLLRGGDQVRSADASALLNEESQLTRTEGASTSSILPSGIASAAGRGGLPDGIATPVTPRGTLTGGSVILPAMAPRREEDYEALLARYHRQTYENARLLSTVEDLRRQIADSCARKTRTQSGDVIPPPPPVSNTPTIAEAESTALVNSSDKPGASVASVESGTSEVTAVEQQANEQQEQQDLHEQLPDEFLAQAMQGFEQIRLLLTSDASTNAYLHTLASHGYIDGSAAVPDLAIFHSTHSHQPPSGGGESSADMPPVAVGAAVREVVTAASRVRAGLAAMLRYPLIAFMDFKVGDIALFMPQQVENRKIWIAFNSSFPYRFLSDSSLDSFQANSKQKENRKYILGRIVLIDTHTAAERLNPYQLPLGTVFHVCHCEPLINKAVSGGVTSPSWTSSAVMGVAARTALTKTASSSSSADPTASATLSGSLPAASASSSSAGGGEKK